MPWHRRRRFRQFPTDRRTGAWLVGVMGIALFLAAGAPGALGTETASGNWLDLTTRTRVQLDESVVVVTGDDAEDSVLVQEILTSKGPASAGARPGAPLKAIDFRAMAYRAAKGAGIKSPTLFVRQMAAESGMRPCAVSYAGAIGIAQIMPATARSWGVDPWIPADALRAAAKNMAKYERQLGSYSLALAAYNAGPGAVQRFGGVPPYAETRGYIARITDRSAALPGMGQTFAIPGRMTPTFARKVRELTADVQAHGGTLKVAEGWRSYEDSTRVWKAVKVKVGGDWQRAMKFAAPPGCSNHVLGQAATLTGSTGLARRLAAKHGLLFPYSYKPGYVELAGIRTQSGALR